MKTELQVDASGKMTPPTSKTPVGESSRRQQTSDQKRKAHAPAANSRLVAAVDGQQPEAQAGPKCQKGGKPVWQLAFSFDQALDAPCKFHRGAKPSNHTTGK